ncbi:glycosyltransferase family 8 C-terminal domain-containing protein, partial [Escherichia coli]
VLIHYTGITKPWHSWAGYPSASYFNIEREQSPWKKLTRQHHTKNSYRYRRKHLALGRFLFYYLLNTKTVLL